MNRIKQTARAASQEGGFTLPELLLATTLLLGLLAVMGGMIVVVVGTQPRIAERSGQIQSGRAMIERITRELREGSAVETGPSASSLSLVTFVRKQECGSPEPTASAAIPAIECRVSYACTTGTGTCMRTEASPDGSAPGDPVTLVEGLNTTEVFGYLPSTEDPQHVTVTLEYPAAGDGESITLSDGAALRNVAG